MGNFNLLGDDWFKVSGATSTVVDSQPWSRNPKLKVLSGDAFGSFGHNKWNEMFQEKDGWKKEFQNTVLLGRYGWNVTDMHILGDAGVQMMVDIFDEINKTRPVKGRRFGMVHGVMRPPDLVRRLADYEAVLSLGPYIGFLGNEQNFVTQYGADQMAAIHPIRSMIDAGLKPVLEVTNGIGIGAHPLDPFRDRIKQVVARGAGSGETGGRGRSGAGGSGEDMTGDSPYATSLWDRYGTQWYMLNLEKFITRRNEYSGKVWGPNERITRQEALWMGTNWASRFYNDEKILGTIEPGKLADLVILGGDYMTAPEEKIHEIPVLAVIVGGRITYEKPAQR